MGLRVSERELPGRSDVGGVESALQQRVWRVVRDRFDTRARDDGLTQAALARSLGIRRGQVSIWLREADRMTLKAAARLLDAMDADLDCTVRPRSNKDDR